jgi:hypothetical protein
MSEPAKVEFVQENPETLFEEKDWPLRYVLYVFVGTLVFLVISPFILIAAFPRSLPDQSKRVLVEPAPPRLQISTAADLARLETVEDKRLRTYYWIDKENGIVHIPIEDAMKKIVRNGIPGYPTASQ